MQEKSFSFKQWMNLFDLVAELDCFDFGISQKGPNNFCDFFICDLKFPGDCSCSFIASVYEKAFLSCTQFLPKPRAKKLDSLTNVMYIILTVHLAICANLHLESLRTQVYYIYRIVCITYKLI
jgi:hypothetical protein